MSDRTTIKRLLEYFFQAIGDRDMSRLPLGENVSYSGTMVPEAIEGSDAVRKHMSGTVQFIKSFEVCDSVIETSAAAILVQYQGINGVTFEGCYFMDFENDQISRIRTVFDSRPLMQG